MRTKTTKPLALFTVLLLLSNSGLILGQGTAFTYQGRLNHGTNPANGLYEFTFSLYDALTNGNIVGTPVTVAPVPVNNGLFTVTLDFGTVPFSGNAQWLDIMVNLFGSEMVPSALHPRQQITATPYAITAGTLTGSVSASQLTGTIASNNIAPGSITSAMLATGSVSSIHLGGDSVTTPALASGAVTAEKIFTVQDRVPFVTLTNPAATYQDRFGYAVAALGTDRVLVGAYDDDTVALGGGAAYLFSTNGNLLSTFTKPVPAAEEWLGFSVAALGTDYILIGVPGDDTGARNAGVVLLFHTNGTLITTLTNPVPTDNGRIGLAVAGVGVDQVLIGADSEDVGAPASGAAYLFSTNGTLITKFTNPNPAEYDRFGSSVAGLGTDRVLIGAFYDNAGALSTGTAYLFSTNGTLLTTFTNPTPAAEDLFGSSLAAVGTDQVLIGAPRDRIGEGHNFAGAAYLFDTNGNLLTTFTKANREGHDYLGHSVAAVGTDRVLIGAPYESGGTGAAYLFRTDGTLLNVITNPTPAPDQFGFSVAAAGSRFVAIGADFGDAGTNDAGAAYIFDAGPVYPFNPIAEFTPGLFAEGVRNGAVTTASLADGVVTAAKLDPSIVLWSAMSNNVYRVAGNVGIGTATPIEKLHVEGNIFASGTITPNSDQNAKTDVESVDSSTVLERVVALPVKQWRFKTEESSVKHVGPMAQDFYAAFGLGAQRTAIATVDADGVALAAIQGLNQKLLEELERRDAENAQLKQRIAALEKAVTTLNNHEFPRQCFGGKPRTQKAQAAERRSEVIQE